MWVKLVGSFFGYTILNIYIIFLYDIHVTKGYRIRFLVFLSITQCSLLVTTVLEKGIFSMFRMQMEVVRVLSFKTLAATY